MTDFSPRSPESALKTVRDGDPCPRCGSMLRQLRGESNPWCRDCGWFPENWKGQSAVSPEDAPCHGPDKKAWTSQSDRSEKSSSTSPTSEGSNANALSAGTSSASSTTSSDQPTPTAAAVGNVPEDAPPEKSGDVLATLASGERIVLPSLAPPETPYSNPLEDSREFIKGWSSDAAPPETRERLLIGADLGPGYENGACLKPFLHGMGPRRCIKPFGHNDPCGSLPGKAQLQELAPPETPIDGEISQAMLRETALTLESLAMWGELKNTPTVASLREMAGNVRQVAVRLPELLAARQDANDAAVHLVHVTRRIAQLEAALAASSSEVKRLGNELAEAAREINCVGTVAHRIRIFRGELTAINKALGDERDHLHEELAAAKDDKVEWQGHAEHFRAEVKRLTEELARVRQSLIDAMRGGEVVDHPAEGLVTVPVLMTRVFYDELLAHPTPKSAPADHAPATTSEAP